MRKLTFLMGVFGAAIILAVIPIIQTVHAILSSSGMNSVIIGGNAFAITPTSRPQAAAGHGFAGACTTIHGCVNPP
jgi:hypothetical protein